MTDPITLQGRRMNATQTAPGGVVNADTVFEFSQEADLVTASYTGGGILRGYLVGWLEGDRLRFRYAQVQIDGQLDGGASDCELEQLDGGRIRLIEHFQWESREGSGTNVFEEL